MARKIKLIKNRSDIGAGTRGADMGIDAIEIAAINANNAYFNRYPFTDVETHNETIYDMVKNSFAKRIQHVYEQCQRVRFTTEEVMNDGFFPIVLSGDHSSALGTISGVKSAHPEKRLGVVWIDAHADMHSPYTSPTGNIHGMPLAAAINEDNLECRQNVLVDDTSKYWNRMKNIGLDGPKLLPSDIVMFGVRDTEKEEDYLIEKYGIRNFKVDEIRYRGMPDCLNDSLEVLKECDHLYISFDVDSLDCDRVSYGTGTPEPRGFDPEEVTTIIKGLVDSGKVSCLEVVEVNPLLDKDGNKMAETTFAILDAVTPAIEA